MFRSIIFILSFTFIQCEKKEMEEFLKKGEMIGLKTINTAESADGGNAVPKTIKIDKDTIITHNLNLETRNKVAKNKLKSEEKEPDLSYSAVPKEVSGYVEQFKKNMSECLKEVQENDKRTVMRLSPKIESPVHGECLIACVLKRNSVIENKKVNKDNLINLVSKFFAKDTRLMKKLEKNLDQCIEMSAHHHNECDLASKLNDCTNELMASNKHKIVINY